tara:strand:- start:190 stop:636 length:447 start_codon:yes stop_codon:yes gene_type:complete
MALKKVEDGHKTTKIDKVIAGGRGIEVNGIAYWYKKAGGETCPFEAGKIVELEYTHLRDDETDNDLFMIKSLDEGLGDKDKRIDAAVSGAKNEATKYDRAPFEQTKDDKITNMNILNRAVDYCVATGNLSDDEILERCKTFKRMLSEF